MTNRIHKISPEDNGGFELESFRGRDIDDVDVHHYLEEVRRLEREDEPDSWWKELNIEYYIKKLLE